VVSASWPLLRGGINVRLPAGLHEFIAFKAAECRVNGTAGQTSNRHDVEAEAMTEAKRLEDQSRTVREARCDQDYVVCYSKQVRYIGVSRCWNSDMCRSVIGVSLQ